MSLLEEINTLGLIVTDRQCADNIRERAYVIGFILTSERDKFLQNVNLWSDKVAFHSPVLITPDGVLPSIQITKECGDKDSAGWYGYISLPLIQTGESYRTRRRKAGLTELHASRDYSIVTIFDPKWGRSDNSAEDGLLYDIVKSLRVKC